MTISSMPVWYYVLCVYDVISTEYAAHASQTTFRLLGIIAGFPKYHQKQLADPEEVLFPDFCARRYLDTLWYQLLYIFAKTTTDHFV